MAYYVEPARNIFTVPHDPDMHHERDWDTCQACDDTPADCECMECTCRIPDETRAPGDVVDHCRHCGGVVR